MANKAHDIFKEELDVIQNKEVKVFLENAMEMAPANFYGDEEIVSETKKAARVLAGLLEQKKVEGMARDAMLAAVLIADIAKGNLPDEFKHLHPVAVRGFLRPLLPDVNAGMFESIMRAVEGHEGEDSPSESLKPRQGSAEYEIAIAFSVAKMDYITVKEF